MWWGSFFYLFLLSEWKCENFNALYVHLFILFAQKESTSEKNESNKLYYSAAKCCGVISKYQRMPKIIFEILQHENMYIE